MNRTTFLGRLAQDVRGNTIAIMAAAMVPLMGFAGSAIDMARLYVVKVRLQQACDAGALAGRKAMTDTALATPMDSNASAQATAFFNNNFRAGWYQTTAVSFTPAKSVDGSDSTVANAVSATARATVPMAVMGFFGMPARDLVVTCQARYDLADTDVMFVLDTTGSMSCVPSAAANCANGVTSYTRNDGSTGYYNQESSGSKIDALRDAVVLFDTTMRANADPTTHFRYGFVTYSSSVNVGGVIPSQYLQNTTWDYQTRKAIGEYNYGPATTLAASGTGSGNCYDKRVPASGYAWNGSYYAAKNYTNATFATGSGGTCTWTVQEVRVMWRYDKWPVDTSAYVASINSSSPAATVPGRLDGLTSRWRGCIEEVDSSTASSFNVNSLPDDLNPDFVPSSASDKWRPVWPEAEWLRSNLNGYVDRRDDEINENWIDQYEDYTYRGGSTLDQSGSIACGMPAQRLKVWTASEVSNYVHNNEFRPFGGTYHDVGMIWGVRMLSPNGIFASDTAAWPGRNEPSRSIVFMTDGNMAPTLTAYGMYGVEYWDQRVTGGSFSDQTARHNARFRIECDAAKKKGITIYVVAVGVAVNSDLTYCASPGQTFQASSTAALTDAFKSIAQRIAQLRITQ